VLTAQAPVPGVDLDDTSRLWETLGPGLSDLSVVMNTPYRS
jgi:hypothetical protein